MSRTLNQHATVSIHGVPTKVVFTMLPEVKTSRGNHRDTVISVAGAELATVRDSKNSTEVFQHITWPSSENGARHRQPWAILKRDTPENAWAAFAKFHIQKHFVTVAGELLLNS